MEIHRRRLPHIYPEDTPIFLTWNLHGSLLPSQATPPGSLTSGEAFVWLDRSLDNATEGPMYLKRPEIAGIVVDSVYKGQELGHYQLHAFVVMPNHVHLLITPQIRPDLLLKSMKTATARAANRLLNRTGEPF